jgi:hypothetical protein
MEVCRLGVAYWCPTNALLPYSYLIPASFITFSHRNASLRMKAANTSGVLVPA